MNSMLCTIGGSLLGTLVAASVLGLVGYLVRTWLAEHLRQSIKHSFDLELEHFKNEIGKLTAQYNAMQAAANAVLIEGQRASAEWRIKAADKIWRSVLELRDERFTCVTMLDILHPDEYQLFVTNVGYRSTVPQFEDMRLLIIPSVEQARPYVGEKLYALVYSYRAIVGRICYLLGRDIQNGHVHPWFKDGGIRRLLSEVLTQEELKQFETLKSSRVKWTRNLFETRILHDLRRVIAGTHSVDEGLEQAHRIMEAVQVLESQATENRGV